MIAYISHSECLLHDMGVHPEQPDRLRAIRDGLVTSGRLDFVREIEAPLATREQLERVHDPAYIDSLIASAPDTGIVTLDPETILSPGTLRAAFRAAGAGVRGVDLVLSGEFRSVFCAIRPPGHHAEHSRAMGFCFFNNAAVAAGHALEHHNLERVAIIDFDIHHGNGTENIFRTDGRVFLASLFQHPWYPYSGLEHTPEHFIHVPLSTGTPGEVFRDAVRETVLPGLVAFEPQMLLFSAGFDGHASDPLGHFRLREDDFRWITRACREAVPIPTVSMLEGGYDLPALARCVGAHLDGLM